MSKSRRLIEVMEYVNIKKRFTVQELADEFQVSYRTMWRYLQELSELGVPLYSETGMKGGYSILKERHLQAPYEKQTNPFNAIVEKKELHLVGYHFTTPYSLFSEAEVLIPRLWIKLIKQTENMPVVSGTRIGVAHNRQDDFTYWVMVEVNDYTSIPNDMTLLTIPEGRYASFHHYGSMERENINKTYSYITKWLKQNHYEEIDLSKIIEVYDLHYQPSSKKNRFEILIPLGRGDG